METCGQVLAVAGVITNFDQNKSYKENFLTWLQTSSIQDIRKASSFNLDLGAIVGGGPLTIGVGMTDNDYNRLQTALNQGSLSNITDDEAIRFFQSHPDKAALSDWLECMKVHSRAYGLDFEPDRMGKTLYLELKWQPTGNDSLSITRVGEDNVTVMASPEDDKEILPHKSRTYVFTVLDMNKPARGFVDTPAGLAYVDYYPTNIGTPPVHQYGLFVTFSTSYPYTTVELTEEPGEALPVAKFDWTRSTDLSGFGTSQKRTPIQFYTENIQDGQSRHVNVEIISKKPQAVLRA